VSLNPEKIDINMDYARKRVFTPGFADLAIERAKLAS